MNRELLMLVEAISREKNVGVMWSWAHKDRLWPRLPRSCTKAKWISACPSTVTAATTRLSAAGWWCLMMPACKTLMLKSC